MNLVAIPARREPIKLPASAFRLLRGFGAFDDYWKVELLDGQLWGVPAEGYDEPESDRAFPIKLTIEYYELLVKAGAFEKHNKTELIDGSVYAMSPQYRPHGFIKDEIAFRLRIALGGLSSDWHVATEQSMQLRSLNLPQPDIMLTNEPTGDGAIPGSSVGLIVEVADTTLRFDLKQKRSLYALGGIPEYWVVDVAGRNVRQMWDLSDGLYDQYRDVPFGDPIAAATIPGLTVATDRL